MSFNLNLKNKIRAKVFEFPVLLNKYRHFNIDFIPVSVQYIWSHMVDNGIVIYRMHKSILILISSCISYEKIPLLNKNKKQL